MLSVCPFYASKYSDFQHIVVEVLLNELYYPVFTRVDYSPLVKWHDWK